MTQRIEALLEIEIEGILRYGAVFMGRASVEVELLNRTSPGTGKFTDFSNLFLLNGSCLRSRRRFNEG
jgi:hypothetical protein